MLGFFAVTAMIALIGGLIAFSVYRDRKRREALEKMADSLGLVFLAKDDGSVTAPFQRLSLFQIGKSRRATNCMSGDSGEVRLSIFDYQYTTGSGKNQSTRRFTVVGMESPRLRLPGFSLRPENIFDRIGGMLGFQDIDFAEDPAFSDAFVLKGEGEAGIRRLFSPALRAHFLLHRDRSAEGSGNLLIGYGARPAKAEEYSKLLAMAYETFGFIVDRQESGAEPEVPPG